MSRLIVNKIWSHRLKVNHFFKSSSTRRSFQVFNQAIGSNNHKLEPHQIQVRSLAKSSIIKDKKHKKPRVTLNQDELNKVIDYQGFENELNLVCDKLKNEYNNHLNLKAGSGIENLSVKVGHEVFMIKDIAQISSKPLNLMVINCSAFPEAIKSVIEAINESGSNVNIQQEGTVIYIQLPKVTRDYREKLAKSAKTLFTKAKEDITRVQNNYIRLAKKSVQSGVSEDLVYDVTENIKFKSAQMTCSCEDLLKLKTKELMGD